ncbi:MAG: tetratricopeptide repeat protein [Bdellovibrionales bacterium]
MVCLCPAGGRLSSTVQARLDKAAQAHAQGKLDIASGLCCEILAAEPHEPYALHMLGIIAQQQGKSELALQWIDAALTAKPDLLSARFNRSVILRALKRNDEALQSIKKLLEAAPDFAAAWDMGGQILKDNGDLADAAICYGHALGLQPGNAHFHGNYGALLFEQGDLAAAYKETLKAEELDPNYPPLLMGNILRAWGHPEEAAACFARVRALLPHFPDAYASEAMARLQMGDMEEGLALWEKRPDLSPDTSNLPLWQGEKLSALMLYEDQGLGDAIQFLRYIPLLFKRAEYLTLRVRPTLVALCEKNFPAVGIFSENTREPLAKARCRLSSLPYFFGTRLNDIPPAPYLTAPDGALWRKRLKKLPLPRIGLVWAGNANYRNDAARSIDFRFIQPLLSCGADHFVSMQKDLPENVAVTDIFDAAPELNSFSDTASLIGELDLVISVDTATAHLAGALGKPVFVLLPFNSDWRWLLEREDSPWYGSARLFRQKKPGDWTDVIDRVSAEVKKFIAGDKSVLRAKPWQGKNLRKNPYAIPF